MALETTTKSADHHFSISHLISRFRSKKRAGGKARAHPQQATLPDTRPPLIAAPLPLVLPEHQSSLSNLGWTTITFPDSPPEDNPGQSSSNSKDTTPLPAPPPHPLQQAYETLVLASQSFFAQPASQKQRWKHKLGSEEGWSQIPGEKEFITLRTLAYCPEVLRGPAKQYWDLMGAQLSSTLGRISTALGLPDDEAAGLRQFVGPCGAMQTTNAAKTATMLRLFRYEGWEAKEVAEPHADLGLLSSVVGNVPGLEVWDRFSWFACEKEVESAGRKGATLLAGRQLERLSNGRYPAGGHRVVSYGTPVPRNEAGVSATPLPAAAEGGEKQYRFSIVFVLRAHEPVIIDSEAFETDITGKWAVPMRGITAGDFYKEIRGRHFNINIDQSEREKQRRKVRQVKGKELISSG